MRSPTRPASPASVSRRRILRNLLLATLVTSVLLPTAPVGAATETITITDRVTPANLSVSPGTTVTWVNQDTDRHRMRSVSGPEEFDSGNIDPGGRFSFTFTLAGTYSYEDSRNAGLAAYAGTIEVTGSGGGSGGGGAPTGNTVGMAGRRFAPAEITIAAGESVNFLNDDGRDHSATASDGSWDTGVLAPGGSRSIAFDTPGTYPYFCVLHPDMVGTVVVTDADGTVPPPGAPAPAPPPPPAAPGSANIFDFGYNPSSITVQAGASVTFTNTGVAPHTVTARDGTFDSSILNSGQTWTGTFSTPGTYPFFCTLHPDMVGTLVVTDASGAAPPPADSSSPTDPTSTPPPGPPPPPGSTSVSVRDNAFSPKTVTVPVGTTIRWRNDGVVPHTVTDPGGAYDSGIMSPGDTFSRTFRSAGTYDYVCIIHPGMAGRVVVTASDGSVPPPSEQDSLPTGESGVADAPDSSASVVFDGSGFAPSSIDVEIGTEITFTNDGTRFVTFTADDGSFDSGFVEKGASWTHTFTTAGSFGYHDKLDPTVEGLVVVGRSEAGSSQQVTIVDLDYEPRAVTVEAGTTVEWTNAGQAPHTVTDRNGGFDSGVLQNGESWSRTFAASGTYEYFCILHPEMVGTVTVVEAGASDDADASDTDLAAGSIDTPAAPSETDPASSTMTRFLFYALVAAVFGAGVGVTLAVLRSLLASKGTA